MEEYKTPKIQTQTWFSSMSIGFNPIWPGLFWCIRDPGGHIVPPLYIFGLGRVRVPILFGNDLPRSDLPYTKGFMKFGCPEPSKKVFDFWNFCWSKWHLTRFVRVPPYEILVFPTNFIFFQGNEITLWGKSVLVLIGLIPRLQGLYDVPSKCFPIELILKYFRWKDSFGSK